MQGFGEKKSSPNGQITLNIILILKHTGLLQKRVRNLNYFTVKHEAPSPRPLSTRSAPGQVLASTGPGGGAPDAVPRHRLLLFPHEGHTVGALAVSRHLQPTPERTPHAHSCDKIPLVDAGQPIQGWAQGPLSRLLSCPECPLPHPDSPASLSCPHPSTWYMPLPLSLSHRNDCECTVCLPTRLGRACHHHVCTSRTWLDVLDKAETPQGLLGCDRRCKHRTGQSPRGPSEKAS